MGAPRSSTRGRSGRATSLSGGKVRSTHKLHGCREKDGEKENRARSKSRDPNKRASRTYDTPFDEKGRCHYHKNVQLAGKKFGGGWKILHELCPRCMEERNDDDIKSVMSARSTKSVSEQLEEQQPTQQPNKKKWNFFQTKHQPGHSNCQDDDDDRSVKSSRSTRSTKSTRSAGKAAISSRYGSMPFDSDGFCVRHPAVQLAKKKKLGGFKIVHDVCPMCAKENGRSSSRGSRRQRSRSRIRRKLSNDDDKSVTSSRSRASKSKVTTKKKRIRVKNLKYEGAETGRPGRYSGYVDENHRPHGQGVIKYEDGTEWKGIWEQGSQVHGKSKF